MSVLGDDDEVLIDRRGWVGVAASLVSRSQHAAIVGARLMSLRRVLVGRGVMVVRGVAVELAVGIDVGMGASAGVSATITWASDGLASVIVTVTGVLPLGLCQRHRRARRLHRNRFRRCDGRLDLRGAGGSAGWFDLGARPRRAVGSAPVSDAAAVADRRRQGRALLLDANSPLGEHGIVGRDGGHSPTNSPAVRDQENKNRSDTSDGSDGFPSFPCLDVSDSAQYMSNGG